MKRLFISILTILIWCQSFSQEVSLDSTWIIDNFKYQVRLNLDKDTEEELNSELIINRNSEQILIDSIFCTRLYIELRDINSDGFTDLLTYQGSGARANETFNLYLYEPSKSNYKKVEGFNDWPNLKTTKVDGILAACILTGSVEYKFFELNKNGELIDLNISEVDELLDGKAYELGLMKVRELKK